MADAIVRLKLESQEYDAKLKRGIAQMGEMEKQVRRTGASFAYADKEELEFIKSLGEMNTQAQSAKQKLREYNDAITSLTATYRGLTEEERKSQFGKEMAASIDKLKVKAAQLQDIMSDTQREIQNLASDTNFTEGISLMTRTIGTSMAAITAWTGESKEMDAVIKDLAKIGTTVAAVEALTKAFQKQNIVLLKNPYVLAAAGVAALAVAIGKLIKKSQELSGVEKTLQEVEQKGRDGAAQEVTRIDALNSILHDNTRSLEDRKAALSEIQDLVPDYHGALTEEGNLINDNTSAIDEYIDSLQRAATAQAAFDKMVELQKKKMQQQVDLQEKQRQLATEQARNQSAQGQVVYAGTEMTQVYTQQGENRAAAAVRQVEADIRATDAEIAALRNLVKSNDLGTTTGKGTKAGAVTVTVEPVLPEGSIAKLQNELKKAQEKFNLAGTDEERAAAKKDIDEITEAIAKLNGKTQEAAKEGSIAYMRQKLQELNTEWEQAADPTTREELKKQIDEVATALGEMEGKNKQATSALSLWGDHQSKIEDTMNLLRQFYTMMDDPNIGEGQRKWAEGMYESYYEQLQKMMGATDEFASNAKTQFDLVRESLDKFSSGLGAVSTLGNALDNLKNIGEDLASAFSGEMDAWDALMTVFNSGIGILETVVGVLDAINTLSELSSMLSKKKIADQAAETSAVVSGKAEESTAEITEAGTSLTAAGANTAEAASGASKSVSWIPIVGPILAVAAVAAVLGATLAAMSKAKSAGKFATGGIVPGNDYNDGMIANVSSGELILNRAQQSNIAAQLSAGDRGGGSASTPYVSGENIVLGVNNYFGRSGQGEIVTTSMLRRAGINL